MNVFIAKISEMTAKAWEFAEEISEDDRILFIPDKNGNIPYYVYDRLSSLPVKPEFFPMKTITDPYSIVFSLALTCSNADGAICICCNDEIFKPLNDRQFETRCGTVNVVTGVEMENLDYEEVASEDFSSDDQLNDTVKAGEENSGDDFEEEIDIDDIPDEESEIIPDPNNDNEGNDNEPLDTSDDIEKSEEKKEPDTKPKPKFAKKDSKKFLPVNFLNSLQLVDKSGLLAKNASIIMDALSSSEECSIMALSFNLNNLTEDEKKTNELMKILEQDGVIDTLMESLN